MTFPLLAAEPPAAKPQFPQSRFWTETVRLLGLFEKYRDSDDSANAVTCFSSLARYRFEAVCARPGYDPKKQSIVSIFQPKSGGTYLHNRMLQLGYQEFWWVLPSRACHSICYASEEALRSYMLGGCTCHSHARPDPNILAALDRTGVEKIWLHLRNPAESVVSEYHHYLGEGQGGGSVGEQRRHQAMTEAQRRGLAPGMSKSTYVMEKIGWHVEWIAEWLRFARDRPGLVVISYHRELADRQAMFARVFDELGAELGDAVITAPNSGDRYRDKSSNDWREGLTQEAQDYLDLRMRVELECFADSNRLWS
jgi:hypothetical protein